MLPVQKYGVEGGKQTRDSSPRVAPRTTRVAAVESPALCTKSARGGEAAAARKGSPTLPGVRPGPRGLVLPGAGHPRATFNKKEAVAAPRSERGRSPCEARSRPPLPPARSPHKSITKLAGSLQPAALAPRRPSVLGLHRSGCGIPAQVSQAGHQSPAAAYHLRDGCNTKAWGKPTAITLDAPRWHPSRTRAAPTGGAVLLSAALSHLSGHGAGPPGRREDPRRRERLSSRWLR